MTYPTEEEANRILDEELAKLRPLPWNEAVARVLREAEANGWAVPTSEAPDEVKASYDPVTKRITTTFSIPALVAQDMLQEGTAYIDAAGKFMLVKGDPLPPEQRTTHTISITVR